MAGSAYVSPRDRTVPQLLPRGGTGGVMWRRASYALSRHVLHVDAWRLVALSVIAVAVGQLSIVATAWFPPPSLAVVVVGGLLLSFRSLLILVFVTAAVMAYEVARLGMDIVRPGNVLIWAVSALTVIALARSRVRLGLQGARGETMLVDLRDRLQAQGELPTLPEGWQAEVALRSAGAASFSGDFLVSALSRDGKTLELAIVDVSGKGVGAGTRALLLSGAFGGLLGSVPAAQFLSAANRYLLRQEWEEGFATAAHVEIDMIAGHYVVRSAGHPPTAQFVARTGRWELVGLDGPLLGVLPDAEYVGRRGELAPGDALLLYTDGLIEVPGRDLSYGIDRLLGEAERLVTRGFRDGARDLVEVVAQGTADDRALVLVWRS